MFTATFVTRIRSKRSVVEPVDFYPLLESANNFPQMRKFAGHKRHRSKFQSFPPKHWQEENCLQRENLPKFFVSQPFFFLFFRWVFDKTSPKMGNNASTNNTKSFGREIRKHSDGSFYFTRVISATLPHLYIRTRIHVLWYFIPTDFQVNEFNLSPLI